VFAISARAAHLDVDYVELVERSSFDRCLWPQLRRVVRERKADIVHAHEYKTDLLALMLARTDGTIPFATSHGWTGSTLRERYLYYPLDKRLLRAFPLTIAVSGEIRSELVRAGVPADRVRVVLNGIDHRAFRRNRSREPSVRRDLGLSPDDVVIGAIGRLEPQKRFDLLIRACAVLRERWPGIRLLIAGDGSLREVLRGLAGRLLPSGSCRLLGHYEDIVMLHHAMDVFVQSSDYEGTSNAVLEAMALESSIVATAVGGTAEIVEDRVHALLVPPRDVGALVRAIEQTLLDRAAAAARALRARRTVETSLSFDTRMATVEDIYCKLINRSPRRAEGHPGEESARREIAPSPARQPAHEE
jgi:glycosyltransferase involved in cell wall biosynthesis